MALIGNIEWFRGDSYPLELTIKDKETSLALDLTGYTFKLTIDSLKEPPDATTKVFEVDGVLDIDPTTGKVVFTPSAIQTAIAPGNYFYDVQMTDISSNIRTIVKDKWNIKQDISK